MWDNRLIRYMAVLTGGLNLINAASPLIIIVLAKHMGASDGEVGVIFGAAGIGGIAGSLVGGQIQRGVECLLQIGSSGFDALLADRT